MLDRSDDGIGRRRVGLAGRDLFAHGKRPDRQGVGEDLFRLLGRVDLAHIDLPVQALRQAGQAACVVHDEEGRQLAALRFTPCLKRQLPSDPGRLTHGQCQRLGQAALLLRMTAL